MTGNAVEFVVVKFLKFKQLAELQNKTRYDHYERQWTGFTVHSEANTWLHLSYGTKMKSYT